MPAADAGSLWTALAGRGPGADQVLHGASRPGCGRHVALSDLTTQTFLGCPPEQVSGRSVLLAVGGQLEAALALIELDGVARRIVLCPPDLDAQHRADIAATAGCDLVVEDAGTVGPLPRIPVAVTLHATASPLASARTARQRTEWVLLTSGTTAAPKMVVHSLASLAGAIPAAPTRDPSVVWSTFYDIRRYGGLQMLLRALLGGHSIVLSDAREPMRDFLARAGRIGVTHISGTPSHWRHAVMGTMARQIRPRYVRLSGEIADAAILSQLKATYPGAKIAHAFASTEAGVGFAVEDGLPGFPASLLDQAGDGPAMLIRDGSLRIRSARTAAAYLGGPSLGDGDGYVDTGDLIDRVGDRCFFAGRRDGTINVGGLKVHPEAVEAVINRHPAIRMSRAKSRKNPFTGALVVADVVADPQPGPDDTGRALESEIIALCRTALPQHAVPAAIRFVSCIPVTPSGKLARSDA